MSQPINVCACQYPHPVRITGDGRYCVRCGKVRATVRTARTRARVYSPCVGARYWTGIGLIRILAAYQN
jgi:hypothetical protein